MMLLHIKNWYRRTLCCVWSFSRVFSWKLCERIPVFPKGASSYWLNARIHAMKAFQMSGVNGRWQHFVSVFHGSRHSHSTGWFILSAELLCCHTSSGLVNRFTDTLSALWCQRVTTIDHPHFSFMFATSVPEFGTPEEDFRRFGFINNYMIITESSVDLPSVLNVLCTNNAPVVQLGELDGNGLCCTINSHTLHA